ncbi:uncharacterized protein LOC127881289 [Dreissena polymorpha]|uniref:Mab-21-like HhH/H2TH-like domain-containing protein n=1 Tax=Dreissena polymorpha TaxID=45954 RepID=A0A9D4GM46_DREPO|nr:uncharacterized protein LOC127881289 [Dreissena polymorpha]KAH3819535.1 hypothetical protein DPMN_121273 [Dreissena polymorpha]
MADGGNRRNVTGEVTKPGVSSRHSLIQYEHAATETCTLMDFMGYGPHIRQARRDAYKTVDRLMTALMCGSATCFTTGSKAEGLTCFLESDIDVMCVDNNVICIEEGVDSSNILKETTILRACSQKSYPGHCILLLERSGTTITTFVHNALCDDGYDHELLSSALYINAWLNFKRTEGAVILDRVGPSTPSTYYGGTLHQDLVHALHLYCPSILTRWAARPRNWPTNNIVQKVVSLGTVVTPVGFKGSDYEHVEWRLCFNAGENVLVNNLTDIMVKVYVLLKMVKQDVLKPRKKEVTSFTVKNIVLWIAEKTPQSLLHERSLFQWLHEGLYALRVAIDTKELPYYMIPERNLMAACALEHEQKLSWIATINDMIEEGPIMILRLPKIRRALIAHPEPLRWYSGRRIEMEMLELIAMNRGALDMDEDTDVIMVAVLTRKADIMKEVRDRMITEGCRENNLHDLYHSMLL